MTVVTKRVCLWSMKGQPKPESVNLGLSDCGLNVNVCSWKLLCACVRVCVYRQTTFKKSSEVWKTCFLRWAWDGNWDCSKKKKLEPRTREHPPPQFHMAFTKKIKNKKYNLPSCSLVWMNSGRFAQVQKICYWATAAVFVPVITCNRKQHVF